MRGNWLADDRPRRNTSAAVRRRQRVMPVALLLVLAASTGFLRVAHDLTSHVCSCVSGLISCDYSHEHAHESGDCDAARDAHDHDRKNHKHPADEHDCDICAVLHMARHAAPPDAGLSVIPLDIAVQVVPGQPDAIYTDVSMRVWDARGPPMTV